MIKLRFAFVVCLIVLYGATAAPALEPQEIAEIALRSTVTIALPNSHGSGFVVGDGQIATNHHVIEDGIAGATAKLVGYPTKYPITAILATDTTRDLAIVEAPGISAPALSLGDGDAVQIGQRVYAVGAPLDQALEGTFTEGIIGNINLNVFGKPDKILMTAPISPGNSGGPVLDEEGKVIGIAVAMFTEGQNLNLAVPVNYLKNLLMVTAQLSLSPGVKLTHNSSLDIQPSWSPDGRKIVFVSSRDSLYVNHEIYVMEANGSNLIRLTYNSVYDGDPDWSPDGTKIVFTSTRDDSEFEIYVMDVNDPDPIRLTWTVQSYAPSWSPDGSKIAFTSNTRSGGGGEIYVMNADGSNPRNLTQNGADYFDAYPAWSPDGAQIAFSSSSDRHRDRREGIYVMNADGSNPIRLTPTDPFSQPPIQQIFSLVWSPDGTKIAFATARNINVMNADGSNLIQLTESDDIDLFGIDWSPDGHKLVFVSARDGDEDIYVSNVNIEFGVDDVDIPDPNLRAKIEQALGKASGDTITPADMATLTTLEANDANIKDSTGLEYATNLTKLLLVRNSLSDISALSGLTNLTWLNLGGNSISDISALSGLTNLTRLYLWDNSVLNISALAGLINLTILELNNNNVSDISALAGLTNLTGLGLEDNSILNISVLAGLTNLTGLDLRDNSVSDISALAGLTNLKSLYLDNNSVSDISVLSGLTNLIYLRLWDNSVSDISALSGLTNLKSLELYSNSISDLSPLVSNTGLGSGDEVNVKENPLSAVSINTHIPTLQGRGVEVRFDSQSPPLQSVNILLVEGIVYKADGTTPAGGVDVTIKVGSESADRSITEMDGTFSATFINLSSAVATIGDTVSIEVTDTEGNVTEKTHTVTAADIGAGKATFNINLVSTTMLSYTSTIPAGFSFFHVPLDVEGLDTVGDLKAMLGGSVSSAIVYDTTAGSWNSRVDDVAITADLGILLVMTVGKEIAFEGQAWGGGSSMINLNAGTNCIGLPVNDPRVTNISDIIGLFAPDVVVSVSFSTAGGFLSVGGAGDPADGPVMGDAAYMVIATAAGSAALVGDGWMNGDAGAAPIALAGYTVGHQTPVLDVHGFVVDEITGLAGEGFRVKVKNLSTTAALSRVASVETAGGYNMTFVDLKAAHAARVGDVLEITADSPNPLIGVKPVRHIVTVDDVKVSRIQLKPLIAYEIPAETELLANYPNPFNPETWIPYRLAEDAYVTLTIYDGNGGVVRTLDVGHRIAAVYESRSKAIYWDGRNELGEQMASGVYFYHLSAGDYSETRKMVTLK